MNKYISAVLLMCCHLASAHAQEMRNPFDFPILLSGNFGELRPNHFHSGIDFKTQGVEGKPIHAVMDGYVSRIAISPWGYGNAMYISHPESGLTTVYAHLQKFSPEIAKYVKQAHYERESFNLDITLSPDEFPVSKGQIVAYSGNTGSSGGPHLHFEVRDMETQRPKDPIPFFKSGIKDTEAPKIKGISVCPIKDRGIVNGSTKTTDLKITTAKNGKQSIAQKIEAWGDIGLEIKADDVMDNTSNVYGVKHITLSADGEVVFESDIEEFGFDETRYINSLVDYEKWRKKQGFYVRSFIQPGNKLDFISADRRGVLTINEEREYKLVYELQDVFGNKTVFPITIIGKEQEIPISDKEGTEPFLWNSDNRFGSRGIRLSVPKGALYEDVDFEYSCQEDSGAVALTHFVHKNTVPLHDYASISIRITDEKEDVPQDKYGIVSVTSGKKQWVGGSYKQGWISGKIRDFGAYTVAIDTVAPTIKPVDQQTWKEKKRFAFALSDNLSGVKTYRGEIDGDYALFKMNARSVISYEIDPEKVEKGREHTLSLIVIDDAGNKSEYIYDFFY